MKAISYTMPFILLTNFIVFMHKVGSVQDTDVNGSAQEGKKPNFDFDLNEPYVESKNLGNELSTSTTISEVQRKPYVYRPRKTPDQLSQTKKAIKIREASARLREEDKKEELNEYLEKQRIRMRPYLEKLKRETQKYGHSTKPANIKERQLRQKVRLGTATEEEREFVKSKKLKAKSYPSQMKKNDGEKLSRARLKAGIATKEDIEILQRRKKLNRESYQRSKQH